jgi:hypothetical protein
MIPLEERDIIFMKDFVEVAIEILISTTFFFVFTLAISGFL